MSKLSLTEINVLVAVERSMACVSVLSTLILLTTYCTRKEFRSLSNTLIFYASFANLFANVACLMGRDYIDNPDGALCQFQAFLLEMFMQSDPLWSCAMAINVYLCIFRRYDPPQLRKMHWKYALFCYGLPFIPAMFCLFYRDHRGKMYGDATLWCWIDKKWSDVRIYSYYLPIWISIVISLIIYIRVGIVIYKVRADIRALENSGEYVLSDTAISSPDASRKPSSSNTLTTMTEPKKDLESQKSSQSSESTPPPVDTEEDDNDNDNTISRWDSADITSVHRPPPSSYFNNYKLNTTDEEDFTVPTTKHISYTTTHPHRPSTISPLDPTYTHPSRLSRPSISSMSPSVAPSHHRSSSSPQHRMDKLRWAYTKSALLFTVSILITWVPASINRAQGLTHPQNPIFILNLMSAAVLPLQGFWNTVIFFAGSWGVVKRDWRRYVRQRRKRLRRIQEEKERLEREERRRSSGKTLVGG